MKVVGWPAFRKPPWNPYTELLYRHVGALGVEIEEFQPWRLLRWPPDLLHTHWPDALWNDRFAPRAILRASALLGLLRVARWRGVRVVWTVHNLDSHGRRHPTFERLFWRLLVTQLDGLISPSQTGLAAVRGRHRRLRRLPAAVIPIGHFRGFYPDLVRAAEARRMLAIRDDARVALHIGRIRRYKNVPALIRAFRSLDNPASHLLIAGIVDEPGLATEILGATAGASSVQLHLRYIADDEIQVFLRAADLVVLPFLEILNSASAILALSFDRPVLVPGKGAMAELQALVGPEWVRTYNGDLSPEVLRAALDWALTSIRPERAPLSDLEWHRIAQETIALYRAVLH